MPAGDKKDRERFELPLGISALMRHTLFCRRQIQGVVRVRSIQVFPKLARDRGVKP